MAYQVECGRSSPNHGGCMEGMEQAVLLVSHQVCVMMDQGAGKVKGYPAKGGAQGADYSARGDRV